MSSSLTEPVITNGIGHTTNWSDDDEDENLSKLRPVDIEQDVREMARRKRVEAIMTSKLFREELERVVSDSLNQSVFGGGGGTEDLPVMLSEMMNIKNRPKRANGGGGMSIIPINDIRGLESMGYTKAEKSLRCKLASVYRLLDMFDWTQGIYNHITARLSSDKEHFLLNPFGLMYNEITSSSLITVDMQGTVVEAGTTNFGVNLAGFLLHSSIHSSRPDIKCIIHVHTPNIVSVSSLKCGLLPLCQEACLLGGVSYHSYQGLIVNEEERSSLASDLGVCNKVMLLRNHGAVCCGETIEEAFYYAYHLVIACDTQQRAMTQYPDNLVLISDDVKRKTFEAAQSCGGGGVDSLSKSLPGEKGSSGGRNWNVGEMEFEALMRNMDNMGYRTGYTYRYPLVRNEPVKPKSDVELPPSVSSLAYLLDEEHLNQDGPLRALLANLTRAASRAANGTNGTTKWMNSPNVYQKIEVLETGTPDPRKITKWITEDGCSSSTPIKVDDPNQFVPLGTSKKEFRKIQNAMKEGRLAGGITSGPESKLLDQSMSWDQAEMLKKEASRSFSPGLAPDQMELKVGAASKGIIQRDYQNHATVFKSAYAKNPFDNVTEEELVEYKRVIDAKSYNQGTSSPPSFATEKDSFSTGISRNAVTSTIATGREQVYNGDEETDGGNHTLSEGDTSRATDFEESFSSPKKEKSKKKKSGIRTPSFLKKKKSEKSTKKKE